MAESQSLEPSRSAPSSVQIRQAADADAPAIVALIREVLAEVYGERYPVMASLIPTTGAAYLEQPDLCDAFLVAESGGRIVGVVLPYWNNVFDLYVQHAMRARGVGGALLAAAEDALSSRGAWRAKLDVPSEYPDAVAFYERNGWHAARRSVRKTTQVPVFQMTKQLQPWWRAVGPFWLWHLPKLALLLCAVTIVFLCNLPIVDLAKDKTYLGSLTLGVMTFVVAWKVLLWDSGYLRSWKRFGRVLGVVASEYVTLALGAALCLVLLAAVVLGEVHSFYDIAAVIVVLYAVTVAGSEVAKASAAWIWRRLKVR